MPSVSARQIGRSQPVRKLGKAGFAARSVLYLLLGWFALLIAAHHPTPEDDQRGAMAAIVRHTGGFLVLLAIAIGLAGYALWRFSEVAFGVVAKGKGWGPRLVSGFRGVAYAVLATSAFEVLLRGARSQAGQSQSMSARVMSHLGGRWLVAIVGAVVAGIGIRQLYQGISREFKQYFDLAGLPRFARTVVWVLGTFGNIARGAAFTLTGFFVLQAAWQYDPAKARGLDGALRMTASSGVGRWLVGVVGIGLIAFGLYCAIEARWRRT